MLTFADESTKTQQHAGFTTKREANAFRDEVIGQLHTGTYIVYGKIRVEEFMIFWLEDIMRPRITDDTYTTYKSVWMYWNHLLKKLFQKSGKISIMIIQK